MHIEESKEAHLQQILIMYREDIYHGKTKGEKTVMIDRLLLLLLPNFYEEVERNQESRIVDT